MCTIIVSQFVCITKSVPLLVFCTAIRILANAVFGWFNIKNCRPGNSISISSKSLYFRYLLGLFS